MMRRRSRESVNLSAPVDRRKRREVAAAAARLIVEEGVADYRVATDKAMRTLGYERKSSRPDNREISTAVEERFALFQRPEQALELKSLRLAAEELMRQLTQFSPLLRGPVQSGLANRFSEIQLDLLVDDEKTLELFFLNKKIAYQLVTNSMKNRPLAKLEYRFAFRGCQVAATVFMSAADRSKQRNLVRNSEPQADIKPLMAVLQQDRPSD